MRIVHRVRAGRVTERLQSLDGSGREFVRTNDELTCYLPDQHTVLVEPRPDRGPFLGSLPQFDATVSDFYRIEALPATRILGRPARVIAVNPKDQFRFGYRLWLDEKTAMPLKTQLCDSRGQVIEQIFFARLDMPESIPDSDLAPTVRTDGHALGAPGTRASTTPRRRWRPTAPANCRRDFDLTVPGAQTLGGASVPASHLVYSDGLATVSVFVEAPRSAPTGAARLRLRTRQRRAADAGTDAGGLGIRVLHRRAGPPGHRGRRGARADRRVHRALGQNLQRRRDFLVT